MVKVYPSKFLRIVVHFFLRRQPKKERGNRHHKPFSRCLTSGCSEQRKQLLKERIKCIKKTVTQRKTSVVKHGGYEDV
jgi:hypothetical protein